MAFYIDEAAGRIVEVVDGAVPDPVWIVIDSDTATICGVKAGQSVSRDQIAALKDGAVARYRSLTAGSGAPEPAAPHQPVAAAVRPSVDPVAGQQVSLPSQSGGYIAASILALLGWAAAALTSLVKYNDAQSRINSAWEISAIQVQQLNGEVTAHGITALILAMALTVPALLLKR